MERIMCLFQDRQELQISVQLATPHLVVSQSLELYSAASKLINKTFPNFQLVEIYMPRF